MEKYLGVKIINAKPMNRLEYNEFRGWKLPEDEDGTDEGFLVECEPTVPPTPNTKEFKGYVSWSPEDVFREAYRKTSGMTFGMAVEALKLGKCVARSGWNGKGMFVCKQVPATIGKDIVPNMQSLPQAAKDKFIERFEDENQQLDAIYYDNQMIIVKDSNVIDSWVPSSSDVFAEDWMLV